MLSIESKDKIRSFIAIELPQFLRSKLESLQRELKRQEPDVKWVRPEGIHLTLKFLGSISRDEIDRISNVLAGIVPRWPPFTMKIKGLGGFPSIRNPRVLWIGIQEGASEVLSLQRAIEKASLENNFPPEDRPFKPHLTLGRIRSPRGREALLASIETNRDMEIGSFSAQEVSLFQSELKPSGALYTRLQMFQMLAGRNAAPS